MVPRFLRPAPGRVAESHIGMLIALLTNGSQRRVLVILGALGLCFRVVVLLCSLAAVFPGLAPFL